MVFGLGNSPMAEPTPGTLFAPPRPALDTKGTAVTFVTISRILTNWHPGNAFMATASTSDRYFRNYGQP